MLILAGLLLIGIAVLALLQLLLGRPQLTPPDLFNVFLGGGTRFTRVVVFELRLPRLVIDLCAGAMLALAGVLLQDALRNPLASPELLGVSAGASLVIAAITIFHIPVLFVFYPPLALLGGLASGSVVLLLARRLGESGRLVLLGVALVALLHALLISIIALGSQIDIGLLYLFLLGSTANRTWVQTNQLLPWAVVGIPLALALARPLNLLQLGDEIAEGLGLRVVRARIGLMVIAAGLVAAVVAVSGPIAYIALAAPHLARRALGTTNARQVLPIAALIGTFLLTGADILAKNLFSPLELPVGVWTTLLGGPTLLILLNRRLRQGRGDTGGGAALFGAGQTLLRRVLRFYPLVLLGGAGLLLVLLAVHISIGTVQATPAQVLDALLGHPVDRVVRTVVWDLRLPRALIAVLAGAMLALAGALLQATTRNPLAEPELTGASAGGVFVAVLWISQVFGPLRFAAPGFELAVMATLGCLAGGTLVFLLSRQRQGEIARLVLTGVLVATILRSFTSLLLLSHTNTSGAILLWIIGSLNGRTWVHWDVLWPWALLLLPLALLQAGWVNVLGLGDDVARGLGVRVGRVRAALFFTAVLLTAGAVSVVGAVGFVGLVAPHLTRRLVGQDARRLFPLTALCGAALLLVADILARGIVGIIDLPVGAVMALIGAPFLIFLLRQRQATERA